MTWRPLSADTALAPDTLILLCTDGGLRLKTFHTFALRRSISLFITKQVCAALVYGVWWASSFRLYFTISLPTLELPLSFQPLSPEEEVVVVVVEEEGGEEGEAHAWTGIEHARQMTALLWSALICLHLNADPQGHRASEIGEIMEPLCSIK